VPVINKPFDRAELLAVVAKLLAASDRGLGIE
jgi:hypothetical protein